MLHCTNEIASWRLKTLLAFPCLQAKESAMAITLRIDRLAMGAAFALIAAIVFGAI